MFERESEGQLASKHEGEVRLRLTAEDAVDLHLHTLASDGFWTPAELIDTLASSGFKVASVCDHDTWRSVDEAVRLGAERNLLIIPGVEVTARWSDRQWHILVYGVAPGRRDAAAAPFQALIADLETELAQRAEDAWARLVASGRELPSLPEIAAGRPVWPFHVLSAAIKDEHAKDLKTAAELVTELGGGFSADQPLERVVATAHEAGGLCVIAHPGRSDSVGELTEADLDRMLHTIPIDGLEAHYRSHTDTQTALYRKLAAQRGLLISAGSDSHAAGKPVDPRPWRAIWVADLLARLGIAVDPPEVGPIWAAGMDPLAAVPEPTADQADQERIAEPALAQ